MSAVFTQYSDDAVKTGTGKVEPARKFKCTTAARDMPIPDLHKVPLKALSDQV